MTLRVGGFLLGLCAAGGLVACAARSLPAVTPADADRAQQRWPEMTAAQLDRGRTLYAARCSNCHQPVQPSDVPAPEWPGHVDEMRERAHLDDGEATLVKRYLITMAERATR
jgi:cytochrome c5